MIGVILFYGNGYSLEGTVGIYLMLILSLVLTCLLAGVVLVSLLMKDKRVRSKDQAHAFPQLERIDLEMKKNPPLPYDKVSLKEFCDEFRKFSAGELGLYYSIEDILNEEVIKLKSEGNCTNSPPAIPLTEQNKKDNKKKKKEIKKEIDFSKYKIITQRNDLTIYKYSDLVYTSNHDLVYQYFYDLLHLKKQI